MQQGTIQQVLERLRSWCSRERVGFVRVDWVSAYARQRVIEGLRPSLDSRKIPFEEIELPVGKPAEETVQYLFSRLRQMPKGVASITGIEWAVPEGGHLRDTLGVLNFQRENLAALPVTQIWWVPEHLSDQFVKAVPDLESWFLMRLTLAEEPPVPQTAVGTEFTMDRAPAMSVQEARNLAVRMEERIRNAQAQRVPDEKIWQELARPAVQALRDAGLDAEAEEKLKLLPGARKSMELLVRRMREEKGAEAPETLTAMDQLAETLIAQGDPREAARLLEEVVAIRERVLGAEHPETLRSMNELSMSFGAQGDLARARQLLELVLEIHRRVSGEEHPNSLATMSNLALTLAQQGVLGEARRLGEEWLEVTKRVLGEEHPNTLAFLNNLAVTLARQGDLEGANRLQKQVLELCKRVLGEEHPNTLTSMNNLGMTLSRQGDLAGAKRLQEQVLALRKRVLGEEHPDTMKSVNRLAATLYLQGDLAGAKRLEEQALALRTRVLGQEHPDTLAPMENLALVLAGQGDTRGARRLLKRVAEGRKRVLGKDHPDTKRAIETLASVAPGKSPPKRAALTGPTRPAGRGEVQS